MKVKKKIQKKKKKQITIKLPGERYLNLIYAFLLFFAGLILYSKSATMGLIFADDDQIIATVYSEEFSIERVVNQFSKSTGNAFYRPILDISFLLDEVAIKDRIEPIAFHRTNIALHLAAVIVAFFTFIKLGIKKESSLFASLIYLVHPLLTPAVSWISGRNDSLLTLFFLLSFLFYLFYNKKENLVRFAYLALMLFSFALAMFTKETAILMPVFILLYVFFVEEEAIFSTKNIIIYSGLIVIVIVWFLMRQAALSGMEIEQVNSISNFFYNIPALFAYIGKVFLPFQMAATSYYTAFTYISGIIAIALLALPVYLNKKLNRNYYYFGLLWFFLPILATMFFRLPPGVAYFDYIEHRAYLPMFGFLLSLLMVAKAYKLNFRKPEVVGVSALLIVILGISSFAYQDVYANRMSYWLKIAKINPKELRTYYNIGAAYISENKLDTAEVILQKGYEIDSTKSFFLRELANVTVRKGNWTVAYDFAKRAIEKDTIDALSNYYAGKAALNMKDYSDATKYFLRARELGYENPNMLIDIAYAYAQIYRFDEAIEFNNLAIKINPDAIFAYGNLGDIYLSLRKYDKAEEAYIKSLKINNRYVQAYLGLINVSMGRDDWTNAARYAQDLRKIGGRLNYEVQERINQKIAAAH